MPAMRSDPPVTDRACTKCGKTKPLGDFSPHFRGKYGRQPRCKPCCVAANKARYYSRLEQSRETSRLRAAQYRATHPEKRKAQRDAWRQKNPEKEREAKHAWRRANPDYMRDANLRNVHGITLEQFRDMERLQGGACVICRTKEAGGFGRWLKVDHCHKTGRIRGLLCHNCNTGLGHFKENLSFFEAAIAYLKKHSAPFGGP